MVDTKDPHHNRSEDDEFVSELYRASRDEESMQVPKALDEVILAQARQAVDGKSDDAGSEESDNRKVVPLHRRWEIPLSIAASFVLVTFLYINNKDDLPGVLGIGVPKTNNEESIGRRPYTDASSKNLTSADELKAKQRAISSDRSMREGAAKRKLGAPAAMMKVPPAPDSQATGGRSKVHEEARQQAKSSLQQPALLNQYEKPEKKKEMVSGFSGEPVDKPQLFKIEDDSKTEEAEQQPFEVEDWLARISLLWQRGDLKEAKAVLTEFRAHFPDYSLESLCSGNDGLCDPE